MFTSMTALALVATSFAVALAALLSLSLFDRRGRPRLRALARAEQNAIVFLFENETLLDASESARHILASVPRGGTDWAHLVALLQPQFPGLSDWVRDLAELGRLSLASVDGNSRVDAEWHDGVARITLVDEEEERSDRSLDRHSMGALQHEIETLRATAEHVPFLCWRETAAGGITWANRAYMELAEALNTGVLVQPWPPARLFDLPENSPDGAQTAHRAALPMPDDGTRRWFDLHAVPLGREILVTAVPADDLVRAETSLSEFVTTLTKTFAHLPIGLAIFDRSRQLALFNPALSDLTLLPAEFLCARPGLFAFLDKLRERRMMPEPKDYKTWRQQMADLEARAVNGTYEETWALPTGQTYRVSGRPQPDGAVAFLFEDISAETAQTRRFRAELEMGQAALDAMPEAVAVFSRAGYLTLSNHAYAELWGTDPSSGFEHMTISEAAQAWNERSSPTPVWQRLREFVRADGSRENWSAGIALADGRVLNCRATALPQGATVITFRLATQLDTVPAQSEPAAAFSTARA